MDFDRVKCKCTWFRSGQRSTQWHFPFKKVRCIINHCTYTDLDTHNHMSYDWMRLGPYIHKHVSVCARIYLRIAIYFLWAVVQKYLRKQTITKRNCMHAGSYVPRHVRIATEFVRHTCSPEARTHNWIYRFAILGPCEHETLLLCFSTLCPYLEQVCKQWVLPL